jgi:ankyrin repeat protein
MRRRNFHRGDLKAAEMDGIFENNYDSIHIPYGQKFNAKKIERLMFQRDMVLNAEWNPKNLPPQRPYKLHRHPCFFGDMNDIFADCCGYCPEPDCAEAIALQKEEDERFVRGEVKFLIDDPGRQSVGSFHPITDSDWSEMAYLTQEALFAAAVAQNDSIKVKKLLEGYEQDKQQVVNKRDQTGRTMLFLAALCSSNDVAQILVDAGARLTARNYDGRTILHLACQMGNTGLLETILKKSKANEEEKDKRGDTTDTTDAENSSDSDGGFEKIKRSEAREELDEFAEPEDDDILDVNLPDWDCCLNPLHYAILQGHVSVVKILLANGVDPTLAIKIPRAPPGFSTYSGVGKQTIFPIVLCAYPDNGIEIARLIFSPGISSRSDFNSSTALHALASLKRVDIVKFLLEQDPNAKGALNHLNTLSPPHWPLHWALVNCDIEMSRLLLQNGAHVTISEDDFVKRAEASNQWWFRNKRDNKKVLAIHYGSDVLQPLEVAVEYGNLDLVRLLVQYGANVTSAPRKSYEGLEWREYVTTTYITDKYLGVNNYHTLSYLKI